MKNNNMKRLIAMIFSASLVASMSAISASADEELIEAESNPVAEVQSDSEELVEVDITLKNFGATETEAIENIELQEDADVQELETETQIEEVDGTGTTSKEVEQSITTTIDLSTTNVAETTTELDTQNGSSTSDIVGIVTTKQTDGTPSVTTVKTTNVANQTTTAKQTTNVANQTTTTAKQTTNAVTTTGKKSESPKTGDTGILPIAIVTALAGATLVVTKKNK